MLCAELSLPGKARTHGEGRGGRTQVGWDDDEAMTVVEWNQSVMDMDGRGLSAVTLFVCLFIWFIPMPSFIFFSASVGLFLRLPSLSPTTR